MRIEGKSIVIQYTKQEEPYVKELSNYLESNIKEILGFFRLKKLEYPVVITFWDDLTKFREYYEKESKKKTPSWLVGCNHFEKNQHRIEMLSLEEMKKCEGHENVTLENIFQISLHEYVHACHREYKNFQDTCTYINEGLATYLSKQYQERDSYEVNYPEERLLKGASYFDYYMFMKYIIENRSMEYVLELIKNKKMQEEDFPNLFEEFSNAQNEKKKNAI